MLPSQARVVIVGGGVMGCGLAYHLAHEGWTDLVLLEKAELTSGSTWHAAGQITHSTSSFGLGKCVHYNIGLYAGALEKETGQSVTWHGCGSFRLAYSEDELDWLRHTLSVGRALGFNIELVGPERIRALHPFYNLEGVLGALHTPEDGHVDPSGVTQALAAGARQLGARILRRCRATDIKQQANGEWRVATEQGEILCEHVVNAGGTYARQMGEWSGLQLPMTSMTHHYFVTDTVPEFRDLERELPVVRDDRLVSGYIRMEQKSGLIGIYEKENPNAVWLDHCPWEAENELFAADYDRVMPWLEAAMERMPVFAELGLKREVHGAISHPPDGSPLIGPAPGVRNYWCCCGTQIGIGWGPGLTRELARWMVHGAADISMREFDPRRFGDYASKDWQVVKAKEDYCLRHEIPFPHFNRLAGRPVKPSPLYQRLKAKGAVYEEVYGHERPRWFARAGVAQQDHYSFRRNLVHDMVAAEVTAVREAVGIMDISAFTKVELTGPDAERFLDRLAANKLPRKVGGIALTHLLNRRGRIEIELTLVKLDEDRFYLVCAAFFEQRLLDHLHHHRQGEQLEIIKRSDDWAAIALQGPRSREVLAANTEAALDNANFRWLSAREIAIAGRRMWAFRMSYAGELGWEIHGPRDDMPAVYDGLWEAGRSHGIADYGSFAMNAMRMEKMFKGAGELTNEVTLPEADVMRFVKLDKGDFLGKAATRASLKGELPWVCAYLSIEPDGVEDGHGGEAVLLDGEVVGTTSSVAYGHSVGTILAFAYVRPQAAKPGMELEVVVMGRLRKARVLGGAGLRSGEPTAQDRFPGPRARVLGHPNRRMSVMQLSVATSRDLNSPAWVQDMHVDHYIQSWSVQGTRPRVIAGAQGSWFWDSDGKRYLDFQSQLVNLNLGHQHPAIVEAIKAQAERLCYIGPAMGNDVRSKLAQLMAEITPGDLTATLFTTGGAAANENAIRLARHYTGRHKVIARYRSYHGATAGALGLTGDPRHHLGGPGEPGVVRMLDPYSYRCPAGHPDPCPVCSGAPHLEEILIYEDAATVAAVILEPIVGTNGLIVPPDGYLQAIREVCDRHGILLILDEVMAGFGRTGKWFACDHWGVTPDILTTAKGINSGYVPLGAMTVSKALADWLKSNRFPGGLTYSGHPLACASGVASIRAYRQENIVAHAAESGLVLEAMLRGLAQRHPSIGEIRGKGLFQALELVRDRATRTPLVPFNAKGPDAAPMAEMMQFAMGEGLYLSCFSNVIRLTPPLNISHEDLGFACAVLDRTLEIADRLYVG